MNSSTNLRQNILDLLRFGAVITVVLAHFTDHFNRVYQIVPANLKLNFIFRYGHIALAVFFLISGYVVTMTSMNKNFKSFFITRFSRLYPLFWISCIIGYLLSKSSSFPTYLPTTSFKGLLSNLTMMPFAFGYELLNPVLWTLILEIFFYTLISILIIFRLWKFALPIITCILIVCFFTANKGDASVISRFTPFLMGGMLFYFIQIKFAKKWVLYTLLILSLICSLQGMRYLAAELRPFYSGPHAYHTLIIWVLVVILFAAFFIMVVKKINLPDHAIYQILGNISYPLYLFHIYWLGIYWYFRHAIQAQLLLCGLIVLMIISSWLLNVYIEKPFVRLVKNVLTNIISVTEKKLPFGRSSDH